MNIPLSRLSGDTQKKSFTAGYRGNEGKRHTENIIEWTSMIRIILLHFRTRYFTPRGVKCDSVKTWIYPVPETSFAQDRRLRRIPH